MVKPMQSEKLPKTYFFFFFFFSLSFDHNCAHGGGFGADGQRRVVYFKTTNLYRNTTDRMAREKNNAWRNFGKALRKAGVKLQTAYMQTKPKRADGRCHGAMPVKRRGNNWTSKRKNKN
jgi:hypothetical protein